MKTEKIKGTRDQYHRVKSDDFLLADGKHEAIIDPDLWEGAREKRKQTGVKWNKTHSLEHEHILSGIVKCPICGTGLAGMVRRRKNKKTSEYKDDFFYRCHHRKKIDEEHFCNFKLTLNQKVLNREVEQVIMDLVNDDECRKYIIRKMDHKVDVTDKHYDRKYQDMQDRLDNLYDKIGELDNAIEDINEKINRAYGDQITSKQVYQILTCFDKIYFEMTDLEKKEFFHNFIESIELYPEKTDEGRILKQIDFKFPVYYEGNEGNEIRLLNENAVETVCLMSS